MESIKLMGFKNTQERPVTSDTRGFFHVSDMEEGAEGAVM